MQYIQIFNKHGGRNMEFYHVINSRRTVRDFTKQTIPEDVLNRIISAGLRAPSHNHQREWEFVILREDTEKEHVLRFVKHFAEIYGQRRLSELRDVTPQQKMYADAVPKQYSMLMQSGLVILPFFKSGNALFQATAINMLNPLASIWCCIENILLAASAEGLACSMRIPVDREGADVAKVVNAPEGYLLPCYLGLGYPSEDAAVLEQIEPEVQNVLHFGKW